MLWAGQVLMFFNGDKKDAGKTEQLLIFGPERSRKGAELKCLSSIETKNPGYITRDLREKTSSDEEFGVDIFCLKDEDVGPGFLESRRGSVRRIIATICSFSLLSNRAKL